MTTRTLTHPTVVAPRRMRIVPLILLSLGVLVMLYPVGATLYNNYKQEELAHKYNQDMLASSPEDLSADLAAAREYNSSLSGVPILDPYLQKVAADPGSAPYRRYLSQLDRSEIMARVRVPTAGIDLPVRHGTFDPVIAVGAGHLYGTSLPVGGASTHSVLTSHTGMSNSTLFDHLHQVKEGDLLYIDVSGETLAYKVDQIKVVLPDQIQDLAVTPGQDHLTLFTCTPYAVNTHRLLVRGERVPYQPELEGAKPDEGVQLELEPWMWGLVAGAGVGLLAIALIFLRERRRAGQAPRGGANQPEDEPVRPRRAAGQ